MSVMTTHAPGTFCWVDLAAHDASAAREFYTRLFGWTPQDNPYGEGENDVYTMLMLDGREAAALFAMDEAQRSMGMPPYWASYVAVASADEAAAKAQELGGTVVAPAFDVMEHGRMAVIQDPTGAMFSVWEARSHIGAGVRDEDNSLVWNELATTDPERAREFYTGLFGWTAETGDYGMPYTTFSVGDRGVGGMYRITEEMEGMPPSWLPYFMVDDVDASVATAQELGGNVVMPAMDVPGVGRMSMLMDPQGASFSVIKPDPAMQSS